MKDFFFILIISLIKVIFSEKDFLEFKEYFLNSFKVNDSNIIKTAIKTYLGKIFNNLTLDEDEFNKCTNKLLNKTNNIYNYLYLFSYSGKELSDLGLQSDCINNGFSYYLLSFNYKKFSKKKIYEFLEQDNFYIGLCLFNECELLINKIFNNNNLTFNRSITNFAIMKIDENKNCDKNIPEEECISLPYYSLNRNGFFSKELTEKEKAKYTKFYILFIITISILSIEITLSLLLYCGYNLYINSKILSKELNIDIENENENDNNEEEDEEGVEGQIIFANNPSQKEKKETCSSKLLKILYKYFSLFTNVIILIIKKTKYFNNNNMGTITQLRIFSLILITFYTNFEILTKISSQVFINDSFYKEIYFAFLKFASFGLDIYICLEGFEVMYKLINFYKSNYYNKGNRTITLVGIIKFYLYSLYKIFGYIILFFIVNYFNRYYIYIHSNGVLYSYYSNQLNKNKYNLFQIFNPKYTFFSYFYNDDKENIADIDQFIYDSKMSLFFVNEFYFFTLFIIIFYIGNKMKSKIYDYSILLFIFISYFITYFICTYSDTYDDNKYYTYKNITRNILLIKYPHISFNHYLIGAFTGLICFYLKDGNSDNSIINDKDCPFVFCSNILDVFDCLIQKLRLVSIYFGLFVLILISLTYNILIYLNRIKYQNENILLEFTVPLKIIYYYESGIFIFTFCFITILLYSYENESKIIGNYNIMNLINRISFTYINTIYLLTYSYYCLYSFNLKLSYLNLWFITIGIIVFFCFENLALTIAFVMPFKIIFKTLLDKCFVINKELPLKEIQYKNFDINNKKDPNSNENDTNSSVNDDDSDSR